MRIGRAAMFRGPGSINGLVTLLESSKIALPVSKIPCERVAFVWIPPLVVALKDIQKFVKFG